MKYRVTIESIGESGEVEESHVNTCESDAHGTDESQAVGLAVGGAVLALTWCDEVTPREYVLAHIANTVSGHTPGVFSKGVRGLSASFLNLAYSNAERGFSREDVASAMRIFESLIPATRPTPGSAQAEPSAAPLTGADTPIKTLFLTVRAFKLTERLKVNTLGELAKVTPSRLKKARGAGLVTIRELAAELAKVGLTFADDPPTRKPGEQQ